MTIGTSWALRATVASAALVASAAVGAALAFARTTTFASPVEPATESTQDAPPDLPPNAAPAPTRRSRRLVRALGLVLLLAAIAAATWSALDPLLPSWVRWTLAGMGLAATTCLVIALLIGPVARYLSGERSPITEIERKKMTASERIEALNAARHTLIQAATGLVVIGGVAFTALGLWYTARTVETAQEGQITDRYTKAVEQLGSSKQDVRLGGIYALQRLATDSPRDKDTIRNVLAAFVRNRDTCVLPVGQKELLKQCTDMQSEDLGTRLEALRDVPISRLDADVFAALGIVPTLTPRTGNGALGSSAHFARARFPRADLRDADLRGFDLRGVDLRGANLLGADLHGVDLDHANLMAAELVGADLVGVDLRNADLRRADLPAAHLQGANLTGAKLRLADIRDADLNNADLSGADLTTVNLTTARLPGADLHDADLRGADLRLADLRGADLGFTRLERTDLRHADLRGVRGQTEAEIRGVALVDATTVFR